MTNHRMIHVFWGVSLCFALHVGAVPVISDLNVALTSSYGLVIDYALTGATAQDLAATRLEVKMKVGSTEYVARALDGATNCVDGAHRVYWNMEEDRVPQNVLNGVVTVAYKLVAADAPYCVIDLSGGTNATSYAIEYLEEEPGINAFGDYGCDETKLVLKRIAAGTYKMRNAKNVTLTRPFYMGIVETTQKQWELVMGTNICAGTKYAGTQKPVFNVSYDMIRGSVEGAKWPQSDAVDPDSFLGRLRNKAKIDFDLPTQAQWEYACRAGTTTDFNFGDLDDVADSHRYYMWSSYNAMSSGAQCVGSKGTNGWGLYDMHGNVWEWCLDWDGTFMYGTDPKGVEMGTKRVFCGGSWCSSASFCTSDSYSSMPPDEFGNAVGFRIVWTLPVADTTSALVSATISWGSVEDPIPEAKTEAEVSAALNGVRDTRLTDNITTVEKYAAFRSWVETVAKTDATARQKVLDSSLAWFAYALDLPTLPETTPTSLSIDSMAANNDGAWNLSVSVGDLSVGSDADVNDLKTVFSAEGATDLMESSFSQDNVDMAFGAPKDGKVQVSVKPKNDAGLFFMRMKMTP